MPKRGQRGNPGPSGNELGRAVLRAEREKLPTPTATDARKGYFSAPGPANDRGRQTLSCAVQSRLWPTPKASPSGPDFAAPSGRGAVATICRLRCSDAAHAWSIEPEVGRVADGVPDRVDRLAALGNALVPQIAEWIGRRALDYERANGGVS